jgi:hypothetical protein
MAGGATHSHRARAGLAVVCAVLAVVGTGLAARRVFGAAEVVTDATKAYPAVAVSPRPGVIGTLAAAPLIVDGRLRVYATTRQLRADAPVDARTQRSPFWSFRRWPAQVVGVVAVGATVVGRWSDGELVAIDARTGRIAWRVQGPPPETEARYTGRRTGAATVYAPDGLLTAGRTVIARGALEAVAIRVDTGRELWRRATPGRECRAGEFTTAGGRYLVVGGCGPEKNIEAYDATSGRSVGLWPPAAIRDAVPLGCRVGRSDCAGVRITDRAGARAWLLRDDRPVPAPALARDGAWLAGELAVSREGGALRAVEVGTGAGGWTWRPDSGEARVIAVGPGRVHVLTEDYLLVTLDAGTGVERSRFIFTYGRERTGWTLGHAYASGGFVLVERLAAEPAGAADPLADDDAYYFIAQPVLLAGT